MQNNSITSQTDIANVTVVTEENQIIVPQPITNVIEVNNPGPQGPVGPQGVAGPSEPFANIGGGVYATTSSIQVSGSFLVSGSSTFTNIGPAIFSGSANIVGATTMSSALVSGNVTVLGTASINTLIINQTVLSTGSNTLGDAANDTQTLYGSVIVPTGSLTVSGSARINGSIGVNRDAFGGRALDVLGGGIRLVGSTNGSFEVNGGNATTTISTIGGLDGLTLTDTSNAILKFSAASYTYSFFLSGGNQRFEIRDQNQSGITRFAIANTGNVLIGTTADAGAKLYISGSTSEALLIASSSAGTALYVSGSGRVGIGTATPLRSLDVRGTARIENGGSCEFDIIGQVNNFRIGVSSTQALVGTLNSFPLTFYTNASERMRIDTAGNVGIGTNNPSASLHIKGATTSSLSSSLLIQDSGSIYSFRIKDNGDVAFNSNYITINGYDTTINSGNGVTVNGTAFIPGYIYRSGTTSGFLTLANDGNTASSIALFGSTHATLPNVIRVTAPSGIQITGSLNISGSTPSLQLGTSNFVGDFTNPAITLGSTSNGIYLDSNRISFKAGGVFSGGFSSDGYLTNQIQIRGTLINDLTTAMFIPYRLNAIGLSSGLGGNDTGAVTLITSGSTRLYVSSSGNVGIGTITPISRLDVRGEATISSSFTLDSQPIFRVASGLAVNVLDVRGNGNMVLGGSSDVGIGTGLGVFTRYSLRVGSLSYTDASAILQADSTTRGFLPPRTSATSLISSPAQGLITYITGSNDGLYYYNSGSQPGWHEVLTNTGSQSITGSLSISGTSILQGAVAINSTNTSTGYPLFVNGVIGATSLTLTQNLTMGENFAISNNGSQTIDIDANNDTTNAVFRVTANGTANELFRVNESGNFGIGTIAPTYTLDVSGSAGSTARFRGSAGQSTVSLNDGTNDNIIVGLSGRLQLRPSGNTTLTALATGEIGIGTTTPTYKLDVSGSVRMNGTLNMSGSLTDYNLIDYSGSLYGTRIRLRDFAWNGGSGVTLDSNNIFLNTAGDFRTAGGYALITNTATAIGGNYPSLTTKFTVQGQGTTSATKTVTIMNNTSIDTLNMWDNGQVAFTSPTMSLAASQYTYILPNNRITNRNSIPSSSNIHCK